MRLLERDKRLVYLHRAQPVTDAYGAVSLGWAPLGVELRAAVQPQASQLAALEYGQASGAMLLMLYDGPEPIALGDGVRVESKTTPDYKVVGLKTWGGHRAMDLEALV